MSAPAEPVEAAEVVTAAAALPPLTDDQCHRVAALLLASVCEGEGAPR